MRLPEGSLGFNIGIFLYHSFITLTTVGYGDITPSSFPARFLCISEAIIGQIYLVVVVSGFVGLFIARKMNHLTKLRDRKNKQGEYAQKTT